MANMIPVPGLEGVVWVQVTATFGAGSDVMEIAFPDKQYSVTAQLKEIKQNSRLQIKAVLDFPQWLERVLPISYIGVRWYQVAAHLSRCNTANPAPSAATQWRGCLAAGAAPRREIF
jgi:hypothetical protein